MTRLTPVVAIAGLLVSACDQQPAPHTSTLQRFDRLSAGLAYLTHASSSVSVNLRSLNNEMQQDSVSGTRRAAVGLKGNALGFARSAGNVGNQVRALARREGNATVRSYYRLVADALTCQWYEGVALARLADIVWADPLLLDRRDETRAFTAQARAARYARQSVLLTRRADALRRRHPRAFRYVPIGVPTVGSRE